MWRMAGHWLMLLAIGAGQTLPLPSARFGTVGRQLSENDVTAIVRLAAPAGRVWTLLAENSWLPATWCRVFLEPDRVEEQIRRGRMVRVERKGLLSATDVPWRVTDTFAYAYVPEGSPGRLSGDLDRTWPFLVSGDFDDEELVSLVTFIRSSPRIPGVREDQAPRNVAGTFPMSAVSRDNTKVIVHIKIKELQGQTIFLERRNEEWVITSVENWIV